VRFAALDGWRGIAALLVAVFHFNGMHHAFNCPVLRNSYLFVDFFFVLSGFVIAHATAGRLNTLADADDFAARRLWRVWPLHLVMLGAFAGLEVVKALLVAVAHVQANMPAFDSEGSAPLSHLFAQVTLTQAFGALPRLTWNHPSWSIAAEYWTYIIFACTVVLGGRWNRLLLGGLAVVSAVLLLSLARDGMNAVTDLGVPRCIFGFVVGVLVQDARREWDRRGAGSRAFGHSEIAVVVGVLWFVAVAARGPMSFAAPLVFAPAVFVFSFEQGVVSKVLKGNAVQGLGRISYSIYMVHVFVVTVINLAISVLQRPLLGRDVFEVVDGHGRLIAGLNPYVLDGMLVIYLAVVIMIARWTYATIEVPLRGGIDVTAWRLSARAAG